MGIFDKKKKPTVQIASPPVGQETPGEIKFSENIENLQSTTIAQAPVQPAVAPVPQSVPVQAPTKEKEKAEYREVPICMSQSQINNLVIENNIILKQIISEMD